MSIDLLNKDFSKLQLCLSHISKKYEVHKIFISKNKVQVLNYFYFTIEKKLSKLVITDIVLNEDADLTKTEIFLKKSANYLFHRYSKRIIMKLKNEVNDRTFNIILNSGFELTDINENQYVLHYIKKHI